MSEAITEPRHGDVVIVRASVAPNGRLDLQAPRRYGVIEWGTFTAVSERLSSLPKDEAVIEARLCASERGRDAWDGTDTQMTRLPRLPLVYRAVADTYDVSIDVTDNAEAPARLRWQSAGRPTITDALRAIEQNGVPRHLAQALIGKAPMPEACS
jgi:hypothetical protein